MPSTVITLDNIRKKYHIGYREAGHRTLRNPLVDAPRLEINQAAQEIVKG